MSTDRIAVYVQMAVGPQHWPEGVVLAVSGDQIQCEYDIRCNEIGDWQTLLMLPDVPGIWIWEGVVTAGSQATGEFRRPTVAELHQLSSGKIFTEEPLSDS